MLLRPFTWAIPVIPGRTSCLRLCVSLYRGRYFTNRGLGPMKLISPLRIFKSSGNSSKRVDRSIDPNLVSLCSSGKRIPCSSLSSVIERNLYLMKIFSPFPTLFWVKITGVPNSSRIKKDSTNKNGEKINMRNKATNISNKRFRHTLYTLYHLVIAIQQSYSLSRPNSTRPTPNQSPMCGRWEHTGQFRQAYVQ